MTPAKRALDLALAIVLLPLVLLALAVLVPWLLLTQGRPLTYVAERAWAPGARTFGLVKLRSMSLDADDDGVTGGGKAASRITPQGAMLRRFRFDELPQAIHVFSGKMSFVGPRPPLPRYARAFPEIYDEVLRMRPGLTGLATLLYHGRERELLSSCATPEETEAVYVARCIPAKARLDRWYARHRNLGLDLWIIGRTLATLAGRPARPRRPARRRRSYAAKPARPTLS